MKQKVCAVISCIVVGLVSCSMIGTAFLQKISGNTGDKANAYDGSKDYLFMDDGNVEAVDTQPGNVFGKSLKMFENVKNISENITSDGYSYKMPFVLLKKTWDKYTGIDMTTSFSTNYESDTVVDVGNGHMSYVVNSFDTKYIENQIEFGKQMENKGINFLMFMTPFKLSENSNIQSGPYTDRSAEIEKMGMQMFRDAGLNVISVSEHIEAEGLDRHELFFKTDHHWLPQTALWANKLMCENLNENYGFAIDTDVFAEENYNIVYADKNWLGTLGKKVTTAYCEPEPFPIIIPKYDTDVTVFVSKTNTTMSGRVEDVLLDWDQLKEPDIYTRRNYDMYAYGDIAMLSIHNNKVNDGRRVLMIKRSFADAMIPYFASTVEYLDVIDLRAFKGSLQAYIDETKPDTVIMLYGVTEVTDESAYDFR